MSLATPFFSWQLRYLLGSELAFCQADGQEWPDATHQLPPRPTLHSSVDGQVLLDASGSQALDLKQEQEGHLRAKD